MFFSMSSRHCLKRHCSQNKRCRYIVPAEDTLKTRAKLPPLTKLKIAEMNEKSTGGLHDRIEIALGMKVMVLMNIVTEADIANRTTGTIEDILLDPRESKTINADAEGRVQLKYPPVLILFRPNKDTDLSHVFQDSRESKQLHVGKGLVPITPSSSTPFNVSCMDGTWFSVIRRQFALTAGYAFTDIKAQAQTIGRLIADLGKPPPMGTLSPFSAYVTLSRSRGRDTIRLLRNFDETLFTKHPNEDLKKEMGRLKELHYQTLNTNCL